jgi:hypothetical protein
MKNKYPALILLLHLIPVSSNAQFNAGAQLDINSINARINAVGHHFWDFDQAKGFEVPAGSGKHCIFNNVMWISARDINNQLYVSGEFYRPGTDYTTGPLSADGLLYTDSATMISYNRLWKISREEIADHIAWHNDTAAYPAYVVPEPIEHWPAHGDTSLGQSFHLAPFIDVNGNGIYEWDEGDYPDIRGDLAIFFIFNDIPTYQSESGGISLGIEVHGMAYAYDCPGVFSNVIFMNYKIYNRSLRNYYDTYIGFFTDFDIGYAYDDYAGCDVGRGMVYGYNADNDDGLGLSGHYGVNPPAAGLIILAGPLMEVDGADNSSGMCDESINGMNFGDGVADNERLGLTSCLVWNFALPGEPVTPENDLEFENAMQGIWGDGTHLKYGGNGHISGGSTNLDCRFIFSGNSDPCWWNTGAVVPADTTAWTEVNISNPTNDRRTLASTGPSRLAASGMTEVDFAFVFARSPIGYLESVQLLKSSADSIRYAFMNNQTPCGDPISGLMPDPDPDDFNALLWPNPASSEIKVSIASETSVRYIIADVWGRKAAAGVFAGRGIYTLNVSDFSSGVYLIQLIGKNGKQTLRFVKTK